MTDTGPTPSAEMPTWHCDGCNDDMHPKFRASHERICAWAATREAAQIDDVLVRLGLIGD